jgi:hypothetical protein
MVRFYVLIPAAVAADVIFHRLKKDHSQAPSEDVFPGDWCQYHEHKDEEETKACKAARNTT